MAAPNTHPAQTSLEIAQRAASILSEHKANDVVLLNQPHVNTDKYEGKTIEQLRVALSGTTGENVVIRRFARFAVGA